MLWIPNFSYVNFKYTQIRSYPREHVFINENKENIIEIDRKYPAKGIKNMDKSENVTIPRQRGVTQTCIDGANNNLAGYTECTCWTKHKLLKNQMVSTRKMHSKGKIHAV